MRIAAHGLSIDPPPGWDARIQRPREDVAGATIAQRRLATSNPVLHAANFALPEDRGDFGSGAVELMEASHALVALVEYDREAASTELFASRGMPRRLAVSDFSAKQLQRTIRGQSGVQRFFSESGRAFCLYVVLGRYGDRASLVNQVNAALERVRIQ
jgi:hypothetical protein